MATDLIKAADDARRILKGFKAFAEVADALEAAGQIEQRTVEAQRVLAEIQPKVAAARAEIDAAQAEAKAIVAKAKEQAAGHVEAAKQHAADIVFIAKNETGVLTAAADEHVKKRQAEAVSAAAARDTALVQRNALAKEVDELEAKLAKTKGQIAKLLG